MFADWNGTRSFGVVVIAVFSWFYSFFLLLVAFYAKVGGVPRLLCSPLWFGLVPYSVFVPVVAANRR